MTLLAAIVFILSLLVLAVLFLLKLGQVSIHRAPVRVRIGHPGFPEKERPDRLWPYFQRKLRALGHLIWHFILEAKDLKPATTKTFQNQVARVKSAFRIRIRSSENDPAWLPEAAELEPIAATAESPEDLYLAAIKKNPNDRQAYEALGRLYLENRNYADAVEIYQFLLRLDAARDIYYSNLGLAHYSQQDYKAAISAYEKALNLNSKVPTRWVNLSLCFEALEDYPRAVKALSQALALDRLNINYLMMLAEAYIKVPNQVRAEEVLEQVLSLEPTNRGAREKLMQIRI